MKRNRSTTEPAAFEMIEEAVHLLRGTSIAAWAVYYSTSVPFVFGLLYFWAYTTWFQPSRALVAWAALLLTVLFLIMKAGQAEFCARLLALRSGAAPESLRWTGAWQRLNAQAALQPWVCLILPFAALATVPFGWVYAYAQSATVIGSGEHVHAEAVEQAKLWPAQNHLALLLIAGVALCLWFNVGVTFLAIPWLANRILGVDNLFGLSGWWFLNSTLLALVTTLTWLAVDPLVKAFYTLRVFHGRARRTGADIRVEFWGGVSTGRRLARVSAAVLLAWVVGVSSRTEAAEAPSAVLVPPQDRASAAGPSDSPAVAPTASLLDPSQLDQSIDAVLERGDFAWRLRPLPGAAEESNGPFASFLREGARYVGKLFRSVVQWVRRVVDWVMRKLTPEDGPRAGRGAVAVAAPLLIYGSIALAVLLLLWLVISVVREARRRNAVVVAAQPVVQAAPDLRDESVHAAQLPAEGWLDLARTEAARGEWRLALRALYLATLARLAVEGLVSLARSKTNLDYERELRRRALSRVELVEQFSGRRRRYEEVWYGRVPAEETAVRTWLGELEGSR